MNLTELENQINEIASKRQKAKALEEIKKDEDFRVGFDFSGIRETVLKKVRAYVEPAIKEQELFLQKYSGELQDDIQKSYNELLKEIDRLEKNGTDEGKVLKEKLVKLESDFKAWQEAKEQSFKDLDNKIRGQTKSLNVKIQEAKNGINSELKGSLLDQRRSFSAQITKQPLKPHRIQDHIDTKGTGQQLNRLTQNYANDYVNDLHKHDPKPIIEEVSQMMQKAILNMPSSSFRLDVGAVGENLYQGIHTIKFIDAGVTYKGGGVIEVDTTVQASVLHNSLGGLQGGQAAQYYHLTSAEYTGTGTGVFVRTSSPTIVTPTIASFVNATHTHQAAASGGLLDHGLAMSAASLLDNDHTQYVNAVADTTTIDLTLSGQSISGVVLPGGIDHGALADLTASDDHTQYVLLAGRAGGQTLYGSTLASENLALDSTSNGTKGLITLNSTSKFLQIGANATSTGTQRDSNILMFENSSWTGSVEEKNNYNFQSISSTTVNRRADLYLKFNSTNILSWANTVGGGNTMTFWSNQFTHTVGSATTAIGSGPVYLFKNSNTTVNNYANIYNQNANGMNTAVIAFKNISHHATTGSADIEFYLANGAAATNLFKMEAAGHFTVLTDSGKVYWGAGKDFSAYYNGTDAYLKTDEVAASDLHITTGALKTMVYDTVVYDDLNFDPVRAGGPVATRPDDVIINNVIHKEFTSANNQLCSSVAELPHKYKLSGTLTPHIHVFLKNAESAGTTGVTFTFYWELRQSTGTTSGSLTLAATTANLGTTAGANTFLVSGVAFAGSAELGGQLAVTIARTSGDAGDVVVTSFGVHYPMDTPGSRDISSK